MNGSYKVDLPDGRRQIVTYSVHQEQGYQAEVTYIGEAKYPDTPTYKATPYGPPEPARQPQAVADNIKFKRQLPKRKSIRFPFTAHTVGQKDDDTPAESRKVTDDDLFAEPSEINYERPERKINVNISRKKSEKVINNLKLKDEKHENLKSTKNSFNNIKSKKQEKQNDHVNEKIKAREEKHKQEVSDEEGPEPQAEPLSLRQQPIKQKSKKNVNAHVDIEIDEQVQEPVSIHEEQHHDASDRFHKTASVPEDHHTPQEVHPKVEPQQIVQETITSPIKTHLSPQQDKRYGKLINWGNCKNLNDCLTSLDIIDEETGEVISPTVNIPEIHTFYHEKHSEKSDYVHLPPPQIDDEDQLLLSEIYNINPSTVRTYSYDPTTDSVPATLAPVTTNFKDLASIDRYTFIIRPKKDQTNLQRKRNIDVNLNKPFQDVLYRKDVQLRKPDSSYIPKFIAHYDNVFDITSSNSDDEPVHYQNVHPYEYPTHGSRAQPPSETTTGPTTHSNQKNLVGSSRYTFRDSTIKAEETTFSKPIAIEYEDNTQEANGPNDEYYEDYNVFPFGARLQSVILPNLNQLQGDRVKDKQPALDIFTQQPTYIQQLASSTLPQTSAYTQQPTTVYSQPPTAYTKQPYTFTDSPIVEQKPTLVYRTIQRQQAPAVHSTSSTAQFSTLPTSGYNDYTSSLGTTTFTSSIRPNTGRRSTPSTSPSTSSTSATEVTTVASTTDQPLEPTVTPVHRNAKVRLVPSGDKFIPEYSPSY